MIIVFRFLVPILVTLLPFRVNSHLSMDCSVAAAAVTGVLPRRSVHLPTCPPYVWRVSLEVLQKPPKQVWGWTGESERNKIDAKTMQSMV